jgi:uncharacterized protein YqhQ
MNYSNSKQKKEEETKKKKEKVKKRGSKCYVPLTNLIITIKSHLFSKFALIFLF